MAFGYPVFLDLRGVPVLLVGGGRVASRKLDGLVAAEALVTVVAPEVSDDIDARAADVHRRPYRPGEAGEYQLVLTATNDSAVNALVAADAANAKVWANSADDPANCSFILPAVARRGPVTVAVSTGGASPALASRLRTMIAEHELTESVEAAAHDLAAERAQIHATGGSTEDVDWSQRVEAALTRASTGHDAGHDTGYDDGPGIDPIS